MIGSLLAGSIGVAKFIPNALVLRASLSSYQDRVRNGTNPAFAAAAEGTQFAASVMLPLPAQMALFGIPVTRAVTSAVITGVRSHNNFVRLSKTPFSHRFEFSETAWRAQQLGLQSIGAAWAHSSMGSEAGMMSRRYSR